MRVNEVLTFLHAEPFQPFVIHMADGERLPVNHEDFVNVAPSGRVMTVFLPDDSFRVLDMVMITQLEILAGNGAKKRRK